MKQSCSVVFTVFACGWFWAAPLYAAGELQRAVLGGEVQADGKTVKGTPVLLKDGVITVQDSFSGNYTSNAVKQEFLLAAENGIKLVFPRGLCGILDDGAGGLMMNTNLIDQGIRDILDVNPDAQIILQCGLNPPWSWYTWHTNKTYLTDFNGANRFPNLHSPEYLNAVQQCLSNLVRFVESQSYAVSISGYHLSAYEGGEWMLPAGYYGYAEATRIAFQNWLQKKYSTVSVLESAWQTNGIMSFDSISVPAPAEFTAADRGPFRDPAKQQKMIDFLTFWQEANADCILLFCRTIKETSGSAVPPLTGVFYGYLMESGQELTKGHLALRKILDSPDIDFLAAPYSYIYRAQAWRYELDADIGAGMFHGPVDSILSNGKLFFSEDDSRTFLTAVINNDDSSKSRFLDAAGTIANLRRNQLVNLTRGSGLWRLDLYGGGWYNSPELMQETGLQKHLSSLLVSGSDYAAGYSPDVAMIVDEISPLYVATMSISNTESRVRVDRFFRDHLSRAGINYGVYLLSDLVAGRVPDCAVYLFAGTYRLTCSDRSWIDANLKKDGKTLFWFYGAGLYDETGWGLDKISSLVEMDIAEASGTAWFNLDPTNALFSVLSSPAENQSGISGHPAWYVRNPATNAQIVAVYRNINEPAIVFEDKGSWTSVYAGAQNLTAQWALGLMRLTGVHQYLRTDNDAEIPVFAGRNIIGIWPVESFTGTVHLKENSDVYDFYSGRLLHRNVSSFPVSLQQWDVRGYKTVPAGSPWTAGMFYEWQQTHFSTQEITSGFAGAEQDSDLNGSSNWQEFIAGTDPLDAQSEFLLSGGKDSFSFQTLPHRQYHIYSRTNLTAGGWMFERTIDGAGDRIEIPRTNDFRAVFYRIDAAMNDDGNH